MDQATVDAIVASVDFGTVIVGIAAVAALLVAVRVVRLGVRMLLGMLGRA